MTVCLYLNGGVPIVITDTLQSRPKSVIYSPENCDFIEQRGRLKALRSNEDGEYPLTIRKYQLTRKWKIFADNVVIAFSGSRSEVDRLIRDYGEYIANSDGSGDVIEKLLELRKTPNSPKIGFTAVAPTGERYDGGASSGPQRFWPFDSGQAVGTGEDYMHFMYKNWLQTQIGTPVDLSDRLNYIAMASDFLSWLNVIHVATSAPYTLRRYRTAGGRTYGGFFQGIYYSPEDNRWFDLQLSNNVSYARISRERNGQSWFCRKLVREVRDDLDREVHVSFRKLDGTHVTECFSVEDAFGTFEGLPPSNLPSPTQVDVVNFDGLPPRLVHPGEISIAENMQVSFSEPFQRKIDAALERRSQ